MGNVLSDAVIDRLNKMTPDSQAENLGTYLDNALGAVLPTGSISTAEMADSAITAAKLAEIPFVATATLTAAAAATPVDVVATASVPAGKKIYITGLNLVVNGGTAWTDATATIVTLQDKAGSPVLAVTAAKAQLTANAVLGLSSAGITQASPLITGVGLTAAVGLTIKGDANFAAGSDILVTVSGIIK